MATTVRETALRAELADRRRRLETARAAGPPAAAGVEALLRDVDAALQKLDAGAYGLCEACHDAVENDRLLADPLVRFCLDHLSADEQRALEYDLELASRIQTALLPGRDLRAHGWEINYHYEPAGPVSGDYCDVARAGGKGEEIFFALGDVSGKGVAASILMSHLQAAFRSLVAMGLPLQQVVERANRLFCESTLASHYATLVCGKAAPSGEIEICNAGHLPPLMAAGGRIEAIRGSGLPIGMFATATHATSTLRLGPGDLLLLYTDGLTEAHGRAEAEYGVERLTKVLARRLDGSAASIVRACLDDLAMFRGGAPRRDDLTVMALRRSA